MQFKAITLIIAIALLSQFTLISTAQDESGYDFRETKWGMSEAEVKASEKIKPTEEGVYAPYDYIIIYDGTIANLNAWIGYQFIDKKLIGGGYVFTESFIDKNQYIDNFLKIKDIMTRKYGTPSEDKVVWSNDLFKDNPQDYGTAVSIGHLTYQSKWQTPTTEIIIGLKGENFKVTFAVS